MMITEDDQEDDFGDFMKHCLLRPDVVGLRLLPGHHQRHDAGRCKVPMSGFFKMAKIITNDDKFQ